MTARTPLPPHLHGTSFHVSEQHFHELRPGRLRSSDVDAPYHGIRSVGIRRDHTLERARIYAPRLRNGQLFSHTTAALLLGMPLPREFSARTELHVSSVGGMCPRTCGVIGHRLTRATRWFVDELPVVSPAETWCQVSAVLSREQLVASGDFLISGRRLPGGERTPPICSLDDLAAASRRFGSQRGAVGIRWALPRLRSPVDSPRESLLRLLLVAHRLPEPAVGHSVAGRRGHRPSPDLCYPEALIDIEYEGEEHRSSTRRWRRDLRRIVLLEEAGWRVIRVTDDDIRDPTVIVRAIRSALRAAASR